MIDFRYHLVSLIAVFLALAVGIVLGAGPLRDTIGETLTGQVQDLRADRERLRAELEAAEADVTERTTYLEAAAPTLLEGALRDQRAALVALPGTEPDDLEVMRERLAQSGAELVAEVAVTEAWTDPAAESFRQTFAGQLLGYLDPAPPAEAGVPAIFGQALGRALTGQGPDGGRDEDAATLLDLLTSADDPFLTITTEPAAAADVTVLVGPRPAPAPGADADPAEEEAAAEVLASHVSLAEGLAGTGPSVTVGAAVSDRDLVAAIRAEGGEVTTVDSVGEVTSTVSAPLAAAVSLSGAQGSYGFAQGAEDAVPPRVELTPDLPAGADAAAGEAGDAAAGEAGDAAAGEPAAQGQST